MEKKLSLSQWASLAEVIASLGVIVSLYFLIVSINAANDHAKAGATRAFYDAVSNVEMAIAADPSWAEIVVKGRQPGAKLGELEQYRYDAYLTLMIDTWDSLQARFEDGLMEEHDVQDWDNYYGDWARRHVTPDTWDRLKWQYTGGMVTRMEQIMAELRQESLATP